MHSTARRAPLRRILIVSLVLALLVVLIGGVWLARSRALALVYPDRWPLTETALETRLPGYEAVTLTTEDDLTLYGWFVPPDSPPGPTIVLLHGFGDNREGMLAIAETLIPEGYGVLLFDMRNHGDSDSDKTTLGYLEVQDVQAAVDFLLERADVDHDRIAVVGHSMGAATAIRSGARIPALQAVVAISGFASLEDNIAEGVRRLAGLPPFPFAPLVVWFATNEAGMDLSAVRPVDDIATISPRPILLIHGDQDELVGVQNSQRLYDSAGEPKMLHIVEGGLHSDFVTPLSPEVATVIVDFLNDALQGD